MMDGGRTTAAAALPERGSTWGLGRLGFWGVLWGECWAGLGGERLKKLFVCIFPLGPGQFKKPSIHLGQNKRHRFACVFKKINKAEREGVAAQLPWDISSTPGGYMKAT